MAERAFAPASRPSRAAAARLDPTLSRLRSGPGPRPAGGLTVGAAHDASERAADRTADRVVRALARRDGAVSPPAPHRCGAACVRRHTGPAPAPAAEVGAAGGSISAGLGARITAASGGGRPLPDGVRTSMEPAFGTDLTRVRVHAGSPLAGRVAATAFTHGRDIHFAPGAYRPEQPSGQWLLAHELAHVVAQDGGVRRHASKEHYLLGALKVDEIRRLASAKASVAGVTGTIAKVKYQKRQLALLSNVNSSSYSRDYVDAVQTIQEQLAALTRWRTATVSSPDPARVTQGGTAYDRALGRVGGAQFDHRWGGQLVTVTCRGGDLACTVGDLNALPDFFGSLDDLVKVDRIVVFKTLQVIRRETYIYLNTLLAELTLAGPYKYNPKKEQFNAIRNNKVSLQGAGSDLANAAVDVMQTETMLAGNAKKRETGLHESIGASATLGRNACHFPPESWLRWLDHHRRARALIAGATDLNDLRVKANRAIGLNAFGEHYLQDSFAAGHLINKGFVMAHAMEYLSDATKRSNGIGDAHIAAFQAATAHHGAYDLPADASARAAQETANQAITQRPSLDDPTVATARDPQTALERGRSGPAGLKMFRQQEEIRGMGLDPNQISFPMYRYWLNDFWLQKITNTLHDRFCVEGLTVGSPAHPAGLFRIFGDSHMIGSEEGTRETALTSRMSHEAINALVENKRAALTPGVAAAAAPVPSEAAIMAHFPNEVLWKGLREPLKDWATGPAMKRLIRKLVAGSSAVTQGKVTGIVRLASPAKSVSAGLEFSHSPF